MTKPQPAKHAATPVAQLSREERIAAYHRKMAADLMESNNRMGHRALANVQAVLDTIRDAEKLGGAPTRDGLRAGALHDYELGLRQLRSIIAGLRGAHVAASERVDAEDRKAEEERAAAAAAQAHAAAEKEQRRQEWLRGKALEAEFGKVGA